MTDADIVIVGGGSAGCVLANRLSANPSLRVVMLEAGGRDWNPWIHIPVGYFRTMYDPKVSWCFKTEADPGLNGRSIDWPRGKVIGGSSSINGLLYVRGQHQDYDRWRQMGNTGWGWEDLLPLFRRSESHEGGDDGLRGRSGPLTVSRMPFHRPICDAWVKAAESIGYPRNEDYNGAEQEGVGYYQLTTRKARRCSAARAYLAPVRKRANLEVVLRARATGLLFAGRRVTGVAYRDAAGRQREVRANREVVLCGGAIGTPQLLMLSGIGDEQSAATAEIDLRVSSPAVGKNLQDHLQARLVHSCAEPTLNDEVNSLPRRIGMALEYGFLRRGPMTMAASLAHGFLKTDERLETPDIQFHIQPWSADKPGEGVHSFSAFTSSVCQLRPESRGEIRLTSPSPLANPAIHPNYLATPLDQQTMVAGVRIGRQITAAEPLRSGILRELQPGLDIESDDELLDWIRDTAVTIFHPTGTCRMGPDTGSVVDPQLRVRGVGGLRVADCSIMPEIVSGNTNAAAIVIGEKASDLISDDLRNGVRIDN